MFIRITCRLTLVALIGAVCLLCISACQCSNASSSGFKVWRAGATEPYVIFLAGPRNNAVNVGIDLDSGDLNVALGSTCEQSVTRAVADDTELAEGRSLFAENLVVHYIDAGEELRQGSAGAPPTGQTQPVVDPEEDDPPGLPSDANPGTPPLMCDPDVDHTAIWVYPDPGFRSLHTTFPIGATPDAKTAKMFDYFEALASKYGR